MKEAWSKAATMPLGVGGARYRLGGAAGPADTVFLGAWRRETLEAAGGFDETLARNEDYEFNWRLRERGGTVWLDPALAAGYRPREGFAALARQYFAWGWWNRAMPARHPRSLRWRHTAAPALVASLAGGAAAQALKSREPAALLLPAVLATMHLAWGAGFWCAVLARRR